MRTIRANCATAGWTLPLLPTGPTSPTGRDGCRTGQGCFDWSDNNLETPFITIATATAGLCFKDPSDSILHYYDEMKAAGAQVIVVLSHLGNTDGGYGYGLSVYGDQTLAKRLNTAGKPANLIIGGHSHSN